MYNLPDKNAFLSGRKAKAISDTKTGSYEKEKIIPQTFYQYDHYCSDNGCGNQSSSIFRNNDNK